MNDWMNTNKLLAINLDGLGARRIGDSDADSLE